ncbi:MAG: hypothetical protein ACYS3S_22195 [Planctomycetota bacterium]
MRKRISCKIIKSVPLGAGNNRPRRNSCVNIQHPKTINIGTSSYTPRLVVINASIDDKPAAQFLDCCA